MSPPDPQSVPEALDRAVRDLGRRLGENPDRVRAVLSDALGSQARAHRAEIDAVVVATEEGIPATLVDRSELVPTQTDVAEGDQRLLARLGERGLNPDAAAFALGTWASALGATTSVSSTPSIEAASAAGLEATGLRGSLGAAVGGSLGPAAEATSDGHLDATTIPRDGETPPTAAPEPPPAEEGGVPRRPRLVDLRSRRAVGAAAAAVVIVVAAAVWATSLRGPGVDLQLADSRRLSTTTTSGPTTTTAGPSTTIAAPTMTKAAVTTTKAKPKPSRVTSTTPARRASSSTPPPAPRTTTPRPVVTPKRTTTTPPPPPPPAPKTLKAGSTSYSYVPYASNNGGPCAAYVGTPANWCRSTFPAIKSGTVTSWAVSSAYSANGHGAVTFSGHNVYYDPHHNGAFNDVVYYRLSGGGVTSNWGSFTVTMSCNTNYQCF
jgi:hypothetical protein